MKFDKLETKVLMVKIIPSLSMELQKQWNLPPDHKSVGMFSTDGDDVGYTAMDEATKRADVKVVLGKSMYGGAGRATQKYAGEFIGVISGPNPAEVEAGLAAAISMVGNEAAYYSANEDASVLYYAHCISKTGSYLSEMAGIKAGQPLAYLIAPPAEAQFGIDAALKAADTRLCLYFEPPSETNYSGALLTGTQSACKAACEAFRDAVVFCAENPLKY